MQKVRKALERWQRGAHGRPILIAAIVLLLPAGGGMYQLKASAPSHRPLEPHRPSQAERKPSTSSRPAWAALAVSGPWQVAPVRRIVARREPVRSISAPALPLPSVAVKPPERPDPAETIIPGSGQDFRDSLANGQPCPDCPQMVVVPAGTFTMGSWIGEEGHDSDESPSHHVTIGRPFAVGRFDVTRGEYAAFVKATGYAGGNGCYTWSLADWTPRPALSWRDPGFAQDDRHPVVCVSWVDVQAYVAWLRRRTARPYRLLSEAEWEYAARAGSQARYFFGDDETKFCRYGNGADRSLISIAPPQPPLACNDGYAFTAPVGSYRPNGFGLHDMLGNALQWVADCLHRNYRGAPTDGSAWADESGDCTRRVGRGGSWLRSADRLRSASRLWSKASDHWFDWGFRVARAIGR